MNVQETLFAVLLENLFQMDMYRPFKGKVSVIFIVRLTKPLLLSAKFESFRESASRNGQLPRTKVILFTEITANAALSARSGFPEGSELYYLQRLHYLDDKPLILNHNYFLKSAVPGLTPEIAEKLYL